LFLAADIQVCSDNAGGECTSSPGGGSPANGGAHTFCAFHENLGIPGQQEPAIVAVMPQASSLGCTSGALIIARTVPNGQLSSDNEIIPLSHELFVSIRDPLVTSGNLARGGQSEIGGDIGLSGYVTLKSAPDLTMPETPTDTLARLGKASTGLPITRVAPGQLLAA
jgi:hypothetical protein